MSKATTTIEGFVSKDPETKDANGQRVVEVTVPHTPRKLNKQTNQYEDAGDTQWWVASFWGEAGDAILANVRKSDLVTVTGQPSPRAYVKGDGSAAVALELKFPTLGVIPRGRRQAAPADTWAAAQPSQTAADAWAAPGAYGDDTPF